MTRSSDARAKAAITYKVIAESNGHKWMEWVGMICCKDCGIIRHADDTNKPCKGRVGIALRGPVTPANKTGDSA